MAHGKEMEQLLAQLGAAPEGLTGEEARRRLARCGPNELAPPKGRGLLLRLLGQLADPMIVLLLVSAGVSLALGGGESVLDAAVILIIVAVNSVLSLVQEDHAQKALEELRRLSAPKARVLRDGEAVIIPAREVVAGDVMELETGDYVPADGRLLWRVFDNLMNNICKYAQPHTRVYVTAGKKDGKAEIVFRNISRDPLNIAPDELTERFVRGDRSRNTEGSGLGLSIARSLTELQGGKFDIQIDGDLFKVTVLI